MAACFSYMNFYGASDTEFVVHAGKFTKEQVIALFIQENMGDSCSLRKPTMEDIGSDYVRYFVRLPDYCNLEDVGSTSGYTFCGNSARGSFPVWVIEFSGLRFKPREEILKCQKQEKG